MKKVCLILFIITGLGFAHAEEVTLSWKPNPVEELVDGYKVFLNGVVMDNMPVPDTTLVVPGENQECYEIAAVNTIGLESPRSGEVCVPPPPSAPGTPTIKKVEVEVKVSVEVVQ